MTKPKRHPKNFFRYFVDEFILFRREFYFELDVEPREIANQLQSRLFPIAPFIREKTSIDKVSKEKLFYIRSGTRNFGIAEIRCRIYQNNQTTHLQFTARVLSGIWILLFMSVFICGINPFSHIDNRLTITSIMCGFAAISLWVYSIYERNKLVRLITKTLHDIKL